VTLSLLVVDEDGAAVTDAAVQVVCDGLGEDFRGTQGEESRTDADGRFDYTMPLARGWSSPGVYFYVSKEGLALGWGQWEPRRNTEATITLHQAVRLAGTVVDEAGEGIAGARVWAIVDSPSACRCVPSAQPLAGLRPFDELIAETDEYGRFAFTNIPPDARARFIAEAPGKARIPTGSTGRGPPWCSSSPGGRTSESCCPPRRSSAAWCWRPAPRCPSRGWD
jgi:hypothetical protein